MNNNTEMKDKLTNTIKEMLESNSVLKHKVIAYKESKESQYHSQSSKFSSVAIANYIGATVLIILYLLEPNNENICCIRASLFFFVVGLLFHFIGKRIDVHDMSNIIDFNDYNILYKTGNKEQKEILELFKYFNGNIKYKEVGV